MFDNSLPTSLILVSYKKVLQNTYFNVLALLRARLKQLTYDTDNLLAHQSRPVKPFSQACENNKAPILSDLKDFFIDRKKVLEVGSGTGQHAVYFAEAMPHLQWQCGDLPENHPGIQQWLNEAELSNVLPPLVTDADQANWSGGQYDAVFSANTLHIMSWQQVERLFQHLGEVLLPSAKLAVYGPFNYQGQFTSDSNARFDQWLKQTAEHQGIRDFEAVERFAQQIGLRLLADKEMPANNRLLLWQK